MYLQVDVRVFVCACMLPPSRPVFVWSSSSSILAYLPGPEQRVESSSVCTLLVAATGTQFVVIKSSSSSPPAEGVQNDLSLKSSSSTSATERDGVTPSELIRFSEYKKHKD